MSTWPPPYPAYRAPHWETGWGADVHQALWRTTSVLPTTVKTFTGSAGAAPSATDWELKVGDGTGEPAGSGWGNGEMEYYRTQNATLDGSGNLLLTAKREAFGGRSYTSARLHGKWDIPAGSYIEAQVTMPDGAGLWPAFWLVGANYNGLGSPTGTPQPWPVCGELDIMEGTGLTPDIARFAIHKNAVGSTTANAYIGWRYPNTCPHMTRPMTSPHTYGIYFDGTRVVRYVNRRPTFSYTRGQAVAGEPSPFTVVPSDWPFGAPMRVMLNVAVGTSTADVAAVVGDPTATDFGAGKTMTVGPISVWSGVGVPF